MEKKKPVIFLSHNKRDKPFVRKLSQKLRSDGLEVWLDEMEIKIGESIHQKVNEGLTKSDFFAVVLSPSSINSKWVQEELSSASSMEKYHKIGIFILPILIEECDVPPLLLDRRYANFCDDEESAYSELLDAISHHFKTAHPDVEVPPAAAAASAETDAVFEDLSLLQKLSPRAFEEFVAELLSKLGYTVELTPHSMDGGKDIIAQREGLPGTSPEKIFIECKRRKGPISVDVVRRLHGVVLNDRASKGIIVTTSHFTSDAMKAARTSPIDLIDLDGLQKWIDQTNHFRSRGRRSRS